MFSTGCSSCSSIPLLCFLHFQLHQYFLSLFHLDLPMLGHIPCLMNALVTTVDGEVTTVAERGGTINAED